MKLSDFVEQLNNIAAIHPDAEVRIAMQPNWPMEHHVLTEGGIKLRMTNADDIAEIEDVLSMTGTERSIVTEAEAIEARAELERLRASNTAIVYIIEGAHIGYAKPTLWDSED